jgi:hypothetical protein
VESEGTAVLGGGLRGRIHGDAGVIIIIMIIIVEEESEKKMATRRRRSRRGRRRLGATRRPSNPRVMIGPALVIAQRPRRRLGWLIASNGRSGDQQATRGIWGEDEESPRKRSFGRMTLVRKDRSVVAIDLASEKQCRDKNPESGAPVRPTIVSSSPINSTDCDE